MSADISHKLTGDWDRLQKILEKLDWFSLSAVISFTLERVLIFYQSEIKRNIKSSGERGGQKFEELADSTIASKGSTKPLIDKGDLINNITYIMKHLTGFVGVERGSTHSENGESLWDIAAVHEFGAIVKLSSGTTFIIPARPFVYPILNSDTVLKKAEDIYTKTILKKLGLT